MKFNQGDKVAFLNENQNGTVISVSGNGLVIVEIEDGFEIEVSERELIKTGSSNVVEKEVEAKVEAPVPLEASSSLLELCNKGTVSFAGVPAATGAVLTGMVDYYLINRTEHEIVFTCYAKKLRQWHGISRGILDRDKEMLLVKFKREDLIEIETFRIEAFVYNTTQRPVVDHIRKETGVLMPGISDIQPGATGVAAFAKIIELYNETEPESIQIKDLIDKFSTQSTLSQPAGQKSSTDKNRQFRPGVHVNEKIVDLHIEELESDFSNLSNAEMLSIQLKKFSSEMDHAIRNHFKRIIFIHGVGNGVLRGEIRKEIKKYSGIIVNDGDYSKFGSGATEVRFE